MAQRNKAVDTTLWNMVGHAAPTGSSMSVINVLRQALPDQPANLAPDRSPEEQSDELLAQAARAYRQLRDKAQHQFEASGDLHVLCQFVKEEPYTLYDPWVRDVLVQRLDEWDAEAGRSILKALKPKKPKISVGGSPQQARDYYRWVVAKVSEKLLSGGAKTVIEAILQVTGSPEDAAKRAAAGMPPAGDDRTRQIYYQEAQRYAWRVMVMAGVGLVGKSLPTESR
jgi:hypothetical protein